MIENKYTVPEGCKITSVDLKTGVVIYECNEPKFKRGDFIVVKWIDEEGLWAENIIIFDSEEEHRINYLASENLSCHIDVEDDGISFNGFINNPESYTVTTRKPTKSEKQLLLDKMYEAGKEWDEEKCEVVDYVWKPKGGEVYWAINERNTYKSMWINCPYDNELLSKDLIFKTKKLAEAANKAQIELLKTLKHY